MPNSRAKGLSWLITKITKIVINSVIECKYYVSDQNKSSICKTCAHY